MAHISLQPTSIVSIMPILVRCGQGLRNVSFAAQTQMLIFPVDSQILISRWEMMVQRQTSIEQSKTIDTCNPLP